MDKKMCSFRFDRDFVSILEKLSKLDNTTKTDVIKRSVMIFVNQNMTRLEKQFSKVKKLM
jgi:hypothetical protein